MKTFSVTALVTSLNSPEKPTHVLVRAENAEAAKQQAKNEIQKKHPNGTVTIGNVR